MNSKNVPRRILKKQFSEDLSNISDSWLEQHLGIKVSVNSKNRRILDRPPPVKIAWEDEGNPEEAVIVKKFTEQKRTPKLTRHVSLEKDSILCQGEIEILAKRQNLDIFLNPEPGEERKIYPKIMQPLMTECDVNRNIFQIRKNRTRNMECGSARQAVVVIPVMENEEEKRAERKEKQEPKAVKEVVIRPATAASKREKFQNRSNSAFNGSAENEGKKRPPLVRSSSAPLKPEKPKFVSHKRKVKAKKQTKRNFSLDLDDGSNGSSNKKNLGSVLINGNDIVTMVSLVSPDGSDNEDVKEREENEVKEQKGKDEEDRKKGMHVEDGGKNLSLRKTVKSVSFQQSSIHAIRSFSASFPSRRASMATTLMTKSSFNNLQKGLEKRVSHLPNGEESMPKKRLVRSQSESEKPTPPEQVEEVSKAESRASFSVDITVKPKETVEEAEEKEEEIKTENIPSEETESENDENPKFQTAKEKQCWEMFNKMNDKGINVSYDTILRGMLTPTEYRMRRKKSLAVEAEAEVSLDHT